MQEIYERDLATQAKSLELTEAPPKVAVVRFISPLAYGQVTAECLNAQGIPATASPDGQGVEYGEVPPSQEQAKRLAEYRCTAMYPIHPAFRVPPSSAAKKQYCKYLVTVRVPCFRKLGYAVSDPPSEAVWVESWNDPWDPEVDVSKIAPNEVNKANLACPHADPAKMIEHPPVLK